jgi:pyruvate dehydrogenase E2 component (dihydrolipoamide acetyltransferase)
MTSSATIADVVMPRLSDSMEQGTIVSWLIALGDAVRPGDPLVEIETDKAIMTYEAEAEGLLLDVLAHEGDTVPIQAVIARIGPAGATLPGDGNSPLAATESPAAASEPVVAKAIPDTPISSSPRASNGRVRASPVARRVALGLGVDLTTVLATGPQGRVVRKDVELAVRNSHSAPAVTGVSATAPQAVVGAGAASAGKGEVEVHNLTETQRVIARRMVEAKASAPEFVLSVDVDMSQSISFREQLKSQPTQAPSFNDLVVKAAAHGLRAFPRVNGSFSEDRWEQYSRVNIGVAVATDDALIVPTIFDADTKSLGTLAAESAALIERARQRRLTPAELSSATLTVSNLGMYGIDRFSAIINVPQAAILAIGAIVKRAVVDDSDQIVVRPMMSISMVCDHRILYGADAAQFLAKVREVLEHPALLAL